jgi:Protein of unknown function (DUF1822)
MMKKVAIQKNGKIYLNVQKTDLQLAWDESKNQSHTLAKHNAYLNRVCAIAFYSWLEDKIKDDLKWQHNSFPPSGNLSNIWEFVNGVAVRWGEARLILIPHTDRDIKEFCVPQEWVDISTWTADYYLDLRVDLDAEDENCWIEILGFTTHRQLKIKGTYNSGDRTYSLPSSSLIEDLDVMAMTLNLNVKADVPELPSLPTIEAVKLIEDLGKPSLYSPRLRTDISFDKWAALLENNTYRQQLFELRMGKVVANDVAEATLIKKAIELRNWLKNLNQKTLDSISDLVNWQSYESLFAETAYSTAVRSRVNVKTNSAETIANIIPLLQPHNSDDIRASAATILGEVGFGSDRAIQALSELLHNDADSNTRLQASLSLGKIDPGNPLAGMRQARLIDLGMKLDDCEIVLIIAIIPNTNSRIKVDLSVKSRDSLRKLPPHLKLSVLKRSGEVIPGLEVETRSDDRGLGIDEIIELPSFNPPPGSHFQVQVSLKNIVISENFIA